MNKGLIAIVPSAGLGRRFGSSRRKILTCVKGIPLFIHTLLRIHREELITEIIPVLRQEDIKKGFDLTAEYNLGKISRIAAGGRERQDSIYSALQLIEEGEPDTCRDSYIFIHDGVRPYIPEGMIEKLLAGIDGVDGVVPGVPVQDTIKEIDRDDNVISTLDRDRVRAVQTPQFFSYRTIREAYDRARQEGYYGTDDAALVERYGGRVRIITGSPHNIKVTTPEDLEMVEYVLKRKNNQKCESE